MKEPIRNLAHTRLYIRYVLTFGVGVGIGLAPFLGRAGIPGFSGVLQLFPVGLQRDLVPLSAFLMGSVAVAVQFYSRTYVGYERIKKTFRRALMVLALSFLSLVIGYSVLVVSVPVQMAEESVAFVTSVMRPDSCVCSRNVSDVQCIQQISLNPAAVESCWGSLRVKISKLILRLNYLLVTASFGAIIGILLIRDIKKSGG